MRLRRKRLKNKLVQDKEEKKEHCGRERKRAGGG